MHQTFINRVIQIVKSDPTVVGLAAGGSWINNQIDAFSDLDLVLVTAQTVSDSKEKMTAYATRFGKLINAFTGEHVGERRLLICMYDEPLLHVDIKFITPEEFKTRVENPVILFDRDGTLQKIVETTQAIWPTLDYQWIEDRFWTWIHYGALKLGRGELFETIDFISFLRSAVIAPLMQIKNGQLPRGLRRIEQNFSKEDLEALRRTIPQYSHVSAVEAINETIALYRELRKALFETGIILRPETEKKCVSYFQKITEKE